jgi:competence protein ComEA
VNELHHKLGRWLLETRRWIAWVGVSRLVGAAVAVVAGTIVLVLGLRVPAPPLENALPRAGATTTVTASEVTSAPSATVEEREPSLVAVHVVGAVQRPGVYVLSSGARADDALRQAGGPSAAADTSAVNLASVVRDGDQLYIPPRRTSPSTSVPPRRLPVMAPSTRMTLATPSSQSSNAQESSSVSQGAQSGMVSLSTATEKELEELPGVGPATAAAIVAHRRAHGPFRRVEDLLNVKGIGDAKLATMRARIVP